MARLQANFNLNKNSRISIKKENLGQKRLKIFNKTSFRDISGLKLWLKVDSGLISTSDDGSNNHVQTWLDQSGNENHASAPAGQRPVGNCCGGRGSIGGLGAVDFVKPTDKLIGTSNVISSLECSIFCVARYRVPIHSPNSLGVMFTQHNAGQDNLLFYNGRYEGSLTRSYGLLNGTNDLTTSDFVFIQGQPYIFSAFIRSPSIGNSEIYQNAGRNQPGRGEGLPLKNASPGTITPGGLYYIGFSPELNIGSSTSLAELLVYNKYLSNDERFLVDMYLSEKYQIY